MADKTHNAGQIAIPATTEVGGVSWEQFREYKDTGTAPEGANHDVLTEASASDFMAQADKDAGGLLRETAGLNQDGLGLSEQYQRVKDYNIALEEQYSATAVGYEDETPHVALDAVLSEEDLEANTPTSHIMHKGSGIEISAYEDGTIMINGLGNPRQGDPLAGTNVTFNPNEKTLSLSNQFEITRQGELIDLEKPAVETHRVNFSAGAENPDLTESTDFVPVRPNDESHENGISTLTSEDGLLTATVYDRERMSQGAVSIQYTDPSSGSITLLNADENTVTIATVSADGDINRSGPMEMTGGAFSANDFRHQAPTITTTPTYGQ